MSLRAGLGIVTAGVIAGELLTPLWQPPVAVLAGVPPLALGAWLVAGRPALGAAAGVLLGAAALGAACMRPVLGPRLPPDDVARLPLPLRTTLAGRIVTSPERRPGRTLLVVAAETVGRGAARRPALGRVRVAVRGTADWRYGDRVAVDAVLRAPRNFENPGRFDYVGHLARQGIRVTAFAWDEAAVVRLPGRGHGVRARLERWRSRLARRIREAVSAPESEVLAALIVGDEGGIDPELRNAFTRAGVVHVLSISGLHVGLVAAGAYLMARWALQRSERLLLAIDVERVAALLSLPPVALYAALAGLGIATLRSALMVAAAALAALAGRRTDVLRTLAVAALVLALCWPGAPFEISFQLSFASVLAIVLGTRRFPPPSGGPRWRTRLASAALVSPCALVGTAPLTAFHFHQVSLGGLIANPLTVPLFGSVVVSLGLAAACLEPFVPWASVGLFRAAGWALRPGIALVRLLGAPWWAASDVPIPTVAELALLYGVLAGILLLPRRAGRVLLAGVLIALLGDVAWWVTERFAPTGLRVTFLDVGQGDAAVAELPGGRVVVIDAGGFPGGDFDTGAAVVEPFLWTRKIRHIDALVMTHAHPDHSGGLPFLLTHRRPREFWWTGVPGQGSEWERLIGALAASGTPERVLAAGSALPRFARGVAVLHPPPGWGPGSLNDSSLTLRIGLGRVGVLLTGDIEARAEQSLLRVPELLESRILKVPHHGSRTSSGPGMLAAVDPAVGVISVGAGNRYRLPSPEVESRYRARGICVLRTDRCGAVTVWTDGRRVDVRAERPGCGCAPAISRSAS